MVSTAKKVDLNARLLVLAPIGRDAELLERVASKKNVEVLACRSPEDFVDCLAEGAGAAILTEEALYMHNAAQIFQAVKQQPQWSRLPFIVLASRSNPEERARKTLELTRPLGNVTLIERPARASTLTNGFEMALEDRKRQYQVRDALEELEESKRALQKLNEELEKRVEERTARLQLAVRELEGFTYSVSHDMRAPVRGLISNARILLDDHPAELSEEAKAHLVRMVEASSKLGALVDDLLKYARLGERSAKRSRFDLSELAQQIAEAVSEDLECPIHLVARPNMMVDADPELIRMVLYNLFHNSCKYRGENEVWIQVGFELNDGKQVFFVQDNGIGFDEKYAHKLFVPFERLHRDSDYPGTGIGLANVKRIIQLHGGKVWAEGCLNRGACFYFTLY